MINVNEKIKINAVVESSCKIHDLESNCIGVPVPFVISAVELANLSKVDSTHVLLFMICEWLCLY